MLDYKYWQEGINNEKKLRKIPKLTWENKRNSYNIIRTFNKRKIKQVPALICKEMEAVLVSEIIMSE